MKRKVLISFFTVILTVSLFCFSSFAIVDNFTDVVGLSYVNIRGLTVGDDYVRSITSGDDYEQSKAYAVEQGATSIQYFYCGFTIKTPSIIEDSAIPTANLGSANSPFYSGYYVHCRLRFKLYCDFRIGSTPNIEHMSLKVRSDSSLGVWNWSSLPTVGEISYGDFVQDADGNWYTECEAVVSYKNDGETINDYSQQFQLCVKGKDAVPFYASVYTYTPYVYDFYYGDGSEPDAPIYKNYGDTVGSGVNDLKNEEDELMENTEQGRNDTISLFLSFGDYLYAFATPLLALKGLIDYFITGTLIEGVLLISLTLGLFSFVLNIVPSIFDRNNRQKSSKNRVKSNKSKNNKGGA